MKIALSQFFGVAPKYDPEQLGEGMAIESLNCDPSRMILEPFYASEMLGEFIPSDTKAMFRYLGKFWLTAVKQTEYAEPAVPNDKHNFIVITDDKFPKITSEDIALSAPPYPTTTFRLGVPTPAEPLPAEYVANPDWDSTMEENLDDLDNFSTNYKITYVDAWGREGAGSTPSERIDIVESENQLKQYPKITMPALPTGEYNFAEGALIRIYRVNTSSQGQGVYQFVDEVPIHTKEYVDKHLSKDLQEAIYTDNWIGAPDDNIELFPNGPMRNVLMHPAGFLVGHNKHELVFSEPYTTHAFPADYHQAVAETIVGIALAGNDVFVGTNSAPRIFSGVHPASMSPVRLPEPWPCVSPQAVKEVGGRIFYASSVGLVAVSGYTQEVVSRDFIADHQWLAMKPATMRFAEYEGRLIIFTEDAGTWLFDTARIAEGFRRLDFNADVYFNDAWTNELVYSINNNTRDTAILYSFGRNKTDRMPLRFISRVIKQPFPCNFPFVKVRANKYPVEFTIYVWNDNILRQEQKVVLHGPNYGLTGLRGRYTRWQFVFEGKPEIRSVELATNPTELS